MDKMTGQFKQAAKEYGNEIYNSTNSTIDQKFVNGTIEEGIDIGA